MRQLLQNPGIPDSHWTRLLAALELPGAEPVQGALAEIFFALDASHAGFKRQALQRASPRLPGHIARWFDAQLLPDRLPRITALATRWSVLARPSADISTRARRCSPDDSRSLAQQVVLAFARDDGQAQQEFLHHCITCHDKLAFMLARQALLRTTAKLPPHWESVSLALEQTMELV